jgi:tRNA (guanine-N7-)-methyltransferase
MADWHFRPQHSWAKYIEPMSAESEHDFGVPIPGRVLPQDQWASTALKKLPPPEPLDFAQLFGRNAPVVLDLGCGNGRFVLTSALRRPELDHLAVDVLPLVIRYATRRANQRGLRNVRIAVIGAYELLDNYIAPGSIAEIHLYHPQPYRDDEKWDQRLVTPQFLGLVHRSLMPDGLFVVQTDNRAYWQYVRRTAPELFEFEELKGLWPDAPAGRTRREIYARKHGLRIYKGQGRPRSLSANAVEQIVAAQPAPNFDARR